MKLILGAAQRACMGETICGDVFSIQYKKETTIAVADGLGHGPKANEAARAFCDFVENHASMSLEEIIYGATKNIANTRGVAAALVRINEQERRLSFSGIGNIEMRAASRHSIRPVCTPGIIGRPIRKTLPFIYELAPRDLLVIHTDGISSRFELEPYRNMGTPQEIAEKILAEFGKNHDDATCIVILCEE